MSDQLDAILASTRHAVSAREGSTEARALERLAAARQPRGFSAALRAAARERPAIIAELKKASPSKGLLCADYRPAATAQAFASAGAAAISVLTDEAFFQGSLADLEAVTAAVSLPVLRKDFMVSPFQMLEARAAGASAILLIVAAHQDGTLRKLAQAAAELSLDVLCEVHDRSELDRAVDLGFGMIGVNCRNLKTLAVDLRVHDELATHLPADALRVAESGIASQGDIERLLGLGYGAFLIGETLMRGAGLGAEAGATLRHLLAPAAVPVDVS